MFLSVVVLAALPDKGKGRNPIFGGKDQETFHASAGCENGGTAKRI